MSSVIVTVKRDWQVRDLEVPANLPIHRLSELIVKALHLDPGVLLTDLIVADPPGRPLDPGETLADAGVWDGAWLEFKVRDAQRQIETPVTKHKLLTKSSDERNIKPPLAVQPVSPEPKKGSGFVWKRLD